MKRTVLIFGAGASFDCGAPSGRNIPVANGLFELPPDDGRHEFHTSALRVWHGIKSRYSLISQDVAKAGGVENYLDQLFRDSPTDPLLLETIYYLRQLTAVGEEIAKEDNNYQKFINWLLANADKIFISDIINFNYDVILDTHLWSSSWAIPRSPAGYLEKGNDRPRLIKPHGSANWYIALSLPVNVQSQIQHSSDAIDNARTKVYGEANRIRSMTDFPLDQIQVGNQTMIAGMIGHSGLGLPRPVIVLPLITKVAVVPAMSLAMTEAIAEANHIILVGYRGGDDAFRNALVKRLSDNAVYISVVGGESAIDVRDTLVALAPAKYEKGFAFQRGFSAFVQQLESGRHLWIAESGLLIVEDAREELNSSGASEIKVKGDLGALRDMAK